MKESTSDKNVNQTNPDCSGLEVMASAAVSRANGEVGAGEQGLLVAFKSGIEQSLALMQQMSEEERIIAFNTLASLCGESSQLLGNVCKGQPPSSDNSVSNAQQEKLKPESPDHRATHDESLADDKTENVSQHAHNTSLQECTSENKKTTAVTTRGKSQRLIAKKNAVPKNANGTSEPKQTKSRNKRAEIKKRKFEESRNNKTDGSNAESEEDSKTDTQPDHGDEKSNGNTSPNNKKTFKCDTCNRTLKSRFSLLVHMRIHTGEKPFACHLCEKTFSCSNNCRRHIRETHEGSRPFNCSHCSMGFFRQIQLDKHLKEDHDLSDAQIKAEHESHVVKREFQVHECKDCGKLFKTKSNLRVHEAVHSQERQHTCPHCNKKFSFRTNLKRHMMLHSGIRPHRCEACNKGFIEYKSLKLHISREHGGDDDTKEPDKFTCEECGKQLSTRASLNNHKLTHTGSKPHVCHICSKAFSMKSNLNRHVRGHSNNKPWECPTCFKGFTEKKSMEVHYRIHTGEKPYSCRECGRSFTQASTLQAHMPVHSKERAVSCEICGKSFLRKSHYRFHMSKHNNPPKHKCADCPRAFYRRADLNRHRLSHTKERPYHCTLCPKQFSRKLYLRDHLNLHLGQRPYTCQHCSATYAESSACVKHTRRCPMRVTSKPPVITEVPTLQEDLQAQGMVQTDDIVVSKDGLDIVTTAMTSAALSSITMTPDGLIVQNDQVTEVVEQEQAAADNLVALANGGIITLEGESLDIAELTERTSMQTVQTEIPTFEQLGLQTIDLNSVKEVHVQDVDTEVGKTKHYIVVIHPGSVPQ